MKITFVGINSSYTHSCLAVYYLYSNCVPDKVEANVKEYNINMPLDYVLSDLKKEDSDVYLFSCYIWNIEYILKIISSLDKITNAVIITGGSEVSFEPKRYLNENEGIDYIVSGEGEKSAYELLVSLKENKKVDIKNVFTRESKSFEYNAEEIDFNRVIFPYKDIDLNIFNNKIIYYESSRGCPFRCSYCLSHLDKRVRFRDIDKVKEELLFFIERGVPLVKFIDRTFNVNEKRTNEIIKFIMENNKDTRFHFEICPDLLKSSTVKLLQEAKKGMFQIEMGIQTINKEALNAINRNENKQIIVDAVKEIKKNNNIHIHTDLIARLPFEDLASFKKSFDFVYNLDSDMIQLGFLKVLSGTDMRKNSGKYNITYSKYPPYRVLKTNWISFEELSLLEDIEVLVDKVYNTRLFKNTLKYFVKNPFDFFERLNTFVKERFEYIATVGKDKLFKGVYDFLLNEGYDKNLLSNVIAFDYLSEYKRNLPLFLSENILAYQPNKEEVFEYIKQNKILSGQNTPKETYKRININYFDFDIYETKNEKTGYIFFYDKSNKLINIKRIKE